MIEKLKQLLLDYGYAVSDDALDPNVLHAVRTRGSEAEWLTFTVTADVITVSRNHGAPVRLCLARVLDGLQQTGKRK